MHVIALIEVRSALLYSNTFARFQLNDRTTPAGLTPWLRNRLNRRFAISHKDQS